MYLSCNFGHLLSVGTYHFEDVFCTSTKGRIGKVGGPGVDMLCTWLAVERPWLTLAGPFLSFLAQMDIQSTSLPL